MNHLKYIKKIIIPALLFVLLFALGGCDSDVKAPYRTVGKPLYTDSITIAFRNGDPLAEIVTASLAELAAQGDVAELSAKWLSSREVGIKAAPAAVMSLSEDISVPSDRTFILGFDANAAPRAIKEGGIYGGFDIELARRLCSNLGWRLRFQPISAENIKIELDSGNVDCAWGFPAEIAQGLGTTEPYLESEIVFAVPQDSDIKRKSHFSETVLVVPSQIIKDYIETSEDYAETFSIIQVLDGTSECFKALDAGRCDLIAVDRLSLEYYCGWSTAK